LVNELNLDPRLAQGLSTYLNQIGSLPQRLDDRGQLAYENYYKPVVETARANVGNFFQRLGTSGVNNSRGQYALTSLADQQGLFAGQRLQEITDAARARELQEIGGQGTLLAAPLSTLLDQQRFEQEMINRNLLTRATGKAGLTQAGAGNIAQLGIAQGNLDNAARDRKGNNLGGLVGGAFNLASIPLARKP